MMDICVECYASCRAEETPRRLIFDGRTVAAADVIDPWLAPDHRDFKLRGTNGATYVIRHNVAAGRWEFIMFDSCAPKR